MRRFELLLIFCGVVTAASPQVKLDYATYVGTSLAAGVNQFLGMRFAAPPLGNRRWRAPEDPCCLRSTATTLSEDCLFIDVYTPSGASETSKCRTRTPNYNGTGVIVESGRNIVVVSAFGFLASERVARDGTLNVGLLDQRKALLWVQKYISKFGGDPNHVVIHGVSAGLLNRISGCGGSVTHHLTAFGGRNDGLFIGAIGESVFWPREAPVSGARVPVRLVRRCCRLHQCVRPNSVPPGAKHSTLVAANVVHPFQGRVSNPDFFYTPTIDGDFVQDHLYTLSGREIIRLTPADVTRITQLYPLRPPLPNHAPFFPSAAAAYGEGTFTCPSNFIAAQINRVRQLVWNYRFSVVQANDAVAGLGVPHATSCDLRPAFIPGGSSTTFATTNAPIVPVVMNYWISFIRSLNPNPHRFVGTPEWAQFNATNQRRLKFVLDDTHVEEIPVDENMRCAFWNEIGARIEQ
ncbi:Alpha/Beta hydrolase protein [Mycena rosella]|uniref:Carboxylic ester hydrolase n=1 Tax=Mycena rosella TaxID=1033263 RepID=A0AAD7D3K9_MYCRO|nr:Alpha/Beta hydrolase protein [Mycena rosella]